jgi:hypothetical protein
MSVNKESLMTAILPGKALAEDLQAESRSDALQTPMGRLIEAAASHALTEDHYFRLIGQLWAMKRMYYYVYGAWGSSLTINHYPPSIDYLFAKQIYDDSTQEMLYGHAILQRGWASTQRQALKHTYCQFVAASGIGVYIFSMRGLANYAQNLRIAAINLGPKVLELDWLERLGEAIPDAYLSKLFSSQVPETRSHVNMGRFMVERFVVEPVDVDICRKMVAMARRDYAIALSGLADFVLGVATETTATPAQVARVDVE